MKFEITRQGEDFSAGQLRGQNGSRRDPGTWLVEAEFAACVWVVTIAAFLLMVGHTLWLRLRR